LAFAFGLGVELLVAIFGITNDTIVCAVSEYARPIKLTVANVIQTLLARIVEIAVHRRHDGRVQGEEIQQYHESEHGHGGVRQKHIVVIILTYIICGTISVISESASQVDRLQWKLEIVR